MTHKAKKYGNFLLQFSFVVIASVNILLAQPIPEIRTSANSHSLSVPENSRWQPSKKTKKSLVWQTSPSELQGLLGKISVDSMSLFVRQLSGDTTVFINSVPETIKTRFAKSNDIFKAQTFLQQKLENFGYQVELQEFSLTPNFGDIIFAPNNPLQGWFYLDGSIYHSSDGGEHWEKQFSFVTDRGIKNFEAVNDSLVWAVGYKGLLMKTSDGGAQWEFLEAPFEQHIYGVAFPDKKHGWIAGAYANIFRTSDGGLTWEKQNLPTTFGIYAIDFVDSLRGWAVGPNGLILHTIDGGENWLEQNSGSSEAFLAVRFFSESRGYAVGTNGTLLLTFDGGESWQTEVLAPDEILWDVDFFNKNDGVVVGSGGKIFITHDSGENWTALNILQDESCYYADFNADSTIWVTGKGVLLDIKSRGADWQNFSDQYVEYYLNNVFATKPGTISPDTSVVICAHYDCMAEAVNRMFLAPGADDNGSGAATVLEAARVLKNENSRYTIRFLLFSGEELGLLGSRHYAKLAAENQENILGVINLDMIGYDGNGDGVFEIHAADIANSKSLGEMIFDNVASLQFPLSPELIVEGATNRSDHASFWEQGFSAILIIEDFDDFNPHYHTIQDLFSNYDVDYFQALGKLAIVSLAQLAGISENTSVSERAGQNQIGSFYLSAPSPNPFNSVTQFHFELPRSAKVKVEIFSITGQKVGRFELGNLARGSRRFIWNSKNNPGGVYFVRFQFGKIYLVRKIVLLR
ncbi:MAG: M20/M25/M40 family metallo-hydrolase [Calditrichaeota bacterium]|nr:M20/M25/M40 family metallo-hydrolase [Calditrichota bacterium]